MLRGVIYISFSVSEMHEYEKAKRIKKFFTLGFTYNLIQIW